MAGFAISAPRELLTTGLANGESQSHLTVPWIVKCKSGNSSLGSHLALSLRSQPRKDREGMDFQGHTANSA